MTSTTALLSSMHYHNMISTRSNYFKTKQLDLYVIYPNTPEIYISPQINTIMTTYQAINSYKLCLTTYTFIYRNNPDYLASLLYPKPKPINKDQWTNLTKTSRYNSLTSTHSKSLSIYAPKIWNKLTSNIRYVKSRDASKFKLKTHLFSISTHARIT